MAFWRMWAGHRRYQTPVLTPPHRKWDTVRPQRTRACNSYHPCQTLEVWRTKALSKIRRAAASYRRRYSRPGNPSTIFRKTTQSGQVPFQYTILILNAFCGTMTTILSSFRKIFRGFSRLIAVIRLKSIARTQSDTFSYILLAAFTQTWTLSAFALSGDFCLAVMFC